MKLPIFPLKKTDYFLNCDYINKYNLKTIYKKPFIKTITFQITYDLLLDNNSKEIQFFNLYLYCLFFSSFIPYIKKINNKVYLKIIYSNSKYINDFLLNILIENPKIFTTFIKDNLINPNLIAFDLNPISFFNIIHTTTYVLNTLDFKVFKIKLLLKYNYPKTLLNPIKSIKNLSFLWLN